MEADFFGLGTSDIWQSQDDRSVSHRTGAADPYFKLNFQPNRGKVLPYRRAIIVRWRVPFALVYPILCLKLMKHQNLAVFTDFTTSFEAGNSVEDVCVCLCIHMVYQCKFLQHLGDIVLS